MMLVLALLFPFLAVMMCGRIGLGFVLLIMQCTLIGWAPAFGIALYVIHEARSKRMHREMIDAIKSKSHALQ